MFSHSLCRIGITAWFEWNRSNIAKQHCENKGKPQMKCNGRCYLKKQIKKLNQNSDAPDKSGNSKASCEDYLVFVIPDYIEHNYLNLAGAVLYFGKTVTFYDFLHERLVFHPPRFASDSRWV
jgi:hypothetical protein